MKKALHFTQSVHRLYTDKCIQLNKTAHTVHYLFSVIYSSSIM